MIPGAYSIDNAGQCLEICIAKRQCCSKTSRGGPADLFIGLGFFDLILLASAGNWPIRAFFLEWKFTAEFSTDFPGLQLSGCLMARIGAAMLSVYVCRRC